MAANRIFNASRFAEFMPAFRQPELAPVELAATAGGTAPAALVLVSPLGLMSTGPLGLAQQIAAQQFLLQVAYEQARKLLAPPRHHTRFFSVWN